MPKGPIQYFLWLGIGCEMMVDERGEEIGAFIPRHVTICHIETSGKQFPALVLRSREITFL